MVEALGLIVLLWKPFAVCFSKWKQQWSITESLIHTIATFILLSYNKLLVVSIRILNGSLVRDSVGTTRLVPYYAANQGYFTGSHVGFATLAVLVLLVVCIPPTLLLLYPFRAFQLCMGRCCHARLQHGSVPLWSVSKVFSRMAQMVNLTVGM